MSLEAALIQLGTVAVRTAAKLWLGDQKVAAEVTASAVDVASARLTKHRDKRKFSRLMDDFAEAIAERLEPLVEVEFRSLPDNEKLAAIEAVRATFEEAPIVDSDLFAADLDAGHLDRAIRKRASNQVGLLSSDGTSFYNLLLRESCGYVIEISRGLPQFSSSALTELLRRDREIIDGIREVLSRLPQRDRSFGFDYDYRQLVARKLDNIEMFGVTLTDASRRYPLTVAYISLTASRSDVDEGSNPSTRIEELLVSNKRLFIRGEAGLGKTTLLYWIAVRSALRDFPEVLAQWNETIPFLIPLRRYVDKDFPAPERFLDEVGRHIADEMPKGWVQGLLRSGRAVVLVDGVDELPSARRLEVRNWLKDIVEQFPAARFIVTSRPGAAAPEWLSDQEFNVLDLEPMAVRDVRVFIERWHDAMRSLSVDEEYKSEIEAYKDGLLDKLETNSHLRRLAGYPLLCALICALHKDRRAVLPENRIELYDVAMQMMLERRDLERQISGLEGFSRTAKTLLLGHLAYWLIRNGRSDIETERAIEQLRRQLVLMPQVKHNAGDVYRNLLERSGLLREPVHGRVDFIHRTFQEYLCARSAVLDSDDVGTLVANAHVDQWHEVVVMAVGHASSQQREELLSGLLERADSEPEKHDTLVLLALASLETAPTLSAELRSTIHKRAAALLPPKTLTAAKSFASAGAFVLDLLARSRPETAKETVNTIRAIVETGSDEAIPLLKRFIRDARKSVQDELFRSWRRFDEEIYAQAIISEMTPTWMYIDDPVKVVALERMQKVRSLTLSLDPRVRFPMGLLPPLVEELSLWLLGNTHSLVLDASEFTGLKSLKALEFFGFVEVANFNSLRLLPNLKSIGVARGVKADDLAKIEPNWALSSLRLEAAEDLRSVDQLFFLDKPESIALKRCASLENVSGLARWAESLEALSLTFASGLDLTPLGSLSNLRVLTIDGDPLESIEFFRGLTSLRHVLINASSNALRPKIADMLPNVKIALLGGFPEMVVEPDV
ncbi:NACHT domain-containing protein [Lentzea atacamensis]|uniref:NACHT domain-containing protein n=2 Tax=Lentzea atacamensis TaxID=531938 RepID=A0ABX9ECV5_9PSEU|nr:NACHT domain-containing protein [Lentzea atacamensis]